MTENEAYDCGAYARVRGLGKDMMPNFNCAALSSAWLAGFSDMPKMDAREIANLMRRKGVI